jgi:hypothetical protein
LTDHKRRCGVVAASRHSNNVCFASNNCNVDRGDILICELWACGTDCIIDVHIADVEAKSTRTKKNKKKKKLP